MIDVKRRRRVLAIASALALTLLPAATANGAEPPIGDRAVSITARELPIDAFLRDLFGQAGQPVTVSPSVTGNVNGSFAGPAREVFDEVAGAFNLVAYYDGAATYVYSGQDLQSRTLNVSPGAAASIRAAASQLNLTDRNNQIRAANGVVIVTGVPRFIEQMTDIASAERGSGAVAAASQADPEPLGFRVFYLKYAWAQDTTLSFGGEEVIVPGVASILRSLVSDPVSDPRLYAGGASSPYPSARSVQNGGAAYQIDERGDIIPTGFNSPASFSEPGAYAWDNSAVRIQADPRLNAIIVRDAQSRLSIYDDLIESLDRPPQLIEIKATIIDLNIDRLQQLGISWRLSDADGENAILFGDGTSDDLRLRRNRDVTPSARGLAISTVIGDDTYFAARVNALEAEGAANIVSRPQVLTLANVEAIFDNSQTFFVRVAGEREVDLFNVSSGTTLRVTPHVYREAGANQIRMLVTIEDGRLTSNAVDDIPVLRNASINTQAVITEGESLLLGGLTSEASEERVDKVPLLGDIPILGAAFRDTVESSGRIERLFLITPRIVPLGPQPAALAGAPAPASVAAPQPAVQPAPSQTAPATPPDPAPSLPPSPDGVPPAQFTTPSPEITET